MRNEITIKTSTDEGLVAALNDGTNRLFINGEEVPSADWVGDGTYETTVEGATITIEKAPSIDGNIQIVQTATHAYALRATEEGTATREYVNGHVQPLAYAARGTNTQTMTTSMENAPMQASRHTYGVPGYYEFTDDGGIKVLKTGRYKVQGFVQFGSLTAGDVVAVRYHAVHPDGTSTNGNQHYGVGNTYATASVDTSMVSAKEGTTVYMQARNATASRGSFSGGNLILEWVGTPND